jgi:hypothetical protein
MSSPAEIALPLGGLKFPPSQPSPRFVLNWFMMVFSRGYDFVMSE